MKKLTFLIIFFLFLFIHQGFAEDNLFCINLDWQLGIRFGIEHKINSYIGMKSDFGIGMPGILTSDALLIIYTLQDKSQWKLNICLGLSNILIPIGSNALMIAPGVSILARHKISKKLNIDIRFGEGFPLFFEKGKKIIRHIQLPFGLWPDFNIGISWEV